ncbi:aminotransferase class IV [Fontivita pretiosa]|uniref:aminotransferase class IV n=1 Tax=Fontivita pretiosa TaxID=2989684 RepID=UPI003D179C96
MSCVWLNGAFVEESTATISLRDTGLLHGAGVFTTMRSYGGRVFRLEQHLRRLRDSCEALFIPLMYRDEQLIAATRELLDRNALRDARLRLTVTRGQATQDPVHGMRLEPNVFLTATQFEPYPEEYYRRGMTVVLLDEQKLNPYDIQAGHKTLNYLSRLSALRHAASRGGGEALWFNVHNYLQSGSISNVFVVRNGTLLTPPTPREMQDPAVRDAMAYPKSAVLPGIMRSAVIDAAREAGIELKLASIDVNALLEADEVFLTNSIMQIMPVCRIERRAIGPDRPGPITQDLSQRVQRQIAETA